MSDDKIRVKDLADKLGVSNKDLLHVLRELDIPAKSTMSMIPTEDLGKVKERMSTPATETAVSRKEIQPGVIVRRRNRDGSEGGRRPGRDEAPESADARESAPAAEAKPAAPEAAPAAKQGAAAPETAVERPARVIEQPAPAARIIRRADEPAPETAAKPVAPVAEAKPAPAAAAAAPAAPAAEAKPAAAPAPEAKPAAETKPAEAATERPAQARPARQASPDASAVPDGTSSAPSLLPPPAADAPREPRGTDDEGDDDGDERRRRKKKKRAPEPVAPQVRVISRPDPEVAARAREAAAAEAARPAQDRGGYRPEGGYRQEGGYRPQGDRPQGDRPGGYRPQGDRPQGDRPGGYRPQGDRPAGPGGYRPQGDRPAGPGGYRPQGDRPAGPGGYRPQGDRPQGDRPQGDRPGGFRPGGGAPGGFRPGGGAPGGFRPGGGGGAPAPGGFGQPPLDPNQRDGQSKKKRNKNRRTVDFQQGGNDFNRRDDDDMPRGGARGRGKRKRDIRPPSSTQPLKAIKRKIKVDEFIRVSDMAHQMGLKSNEIIKILFGLGVMATINQSLDIETATVVAAEFGYEVEKVGFSEDDYLVPKEEDAAETLITRPPVVTIMGHVDHGKTSLLDAIRKSNVTAGEAGGITQHIGAYHVTTKKGEIVFLDTPGHEAFTAMRARGAQVTDLVVLVVAADDGVMEQTREAVNHSKAAGVPIMVAVNKMDKEGANPERVMRELSEVGLVSEDWGGDTVFANVSAKTRQGLDELLELIALQAEILELKANPAKLARGHIVEAKLDKGRGPVATVLIQEGTLTQGATFVCGVFSGRVRAMFNDQGKKVKDAGPSMPIEVQGFDGVPEAGEEFICVADEKLARRIAEARAIKQRERELAKESKITLETFLSRKPSDVEALTLNLVVKADVQGSLEAIVEALHKQSTEKVKINVIHGGAGAITESDILLASASEAIIIGFNVRPTSKVKDIAEQEKVDIRFYDIIYKLVDEIKGAMTGLLAPVQREQYLGQVEVRQVFSVPKVGTIAGCHVSDGKINRNAGVRLLRDGVVVYTGKITSLKRFKDDVREVLKGYECGVGLENYNDIKVGDVVEAFEMIEEAATL